MACRRQNGVLIFGANLSLQTINFGLFFGRACGRPNGVLIFGAQFEPTKKMGSFEIWDSRVVPHLSTSHTQRCLTSEFEWDLVFPPWYERMTLSLFCLFFILNFCRKWQKIILDLLQKYWRQKKYDASTRARTGDLSVNSRSLCQLSHRSIFICVKNSLGQWSSGMIHV